MEENGTEHKRKFFQDSIHENPAGITRRRVVDSRHNIEYTALHNSEKAMNRTGIEHKADPNNAAFIGVFIPPLGLPTEFEIMLPNR